MKSTASFLITLVLVCALAGMAVVTSASAQSHPRLSFHVRHPLVGSWLVTYDVQAFGVPIPILLSFGRDGVMLETDSPAPTLVGEPGRPDSEQWPWRVGVHGERRVCLPLSKVDLPARWFHAIWYYEDERDGKHQRRWHAVRGDALDRVPRYEQHCRVVHDRDRNRYQDSSGTAIDRDAGPGTPGVPDLDTIEHTTIQRMHNMEHTMAQYLSFASAVLAGLLLLMPVAAAVETLTITADQAIVRVKPGITHPILTVVPQGAIFPVLETQEAWHKILLEDGRVGWLTREVGRVAQEARTLTMAAPQPAAAPVAQNRWALVIGNSTYGTDIGPLLNPVNDATDMAAMLRPLGFDVTLILNATRPQMEEALAAFRRQLRPGGVGLFYFAGHGAQVEGTNYLIPIGANVERAVTAKADSMSAEQVLASMTEAGTTLNLLILDACRNNPFWPAGR